MLNELKLELLEILEREVPCFWLCTLMRAVDEMGMAATSLERVAKNLGSLLDYDVSLQRPWQREVLMEALQELVWQFRRQLENCVIEGYSEDDVFAERED